MSDPAITSKKPKKSKKAAKSKPRRIRPHGNVTVRQPGEPILWVFGFRFTREELKLHPQYKVERAPEPPRSFSGRQGLNIPTDPRIGSVSIHVRSSARKHWKRARMDLVVPDETWRTERCLILADNSSSDRISLPSAEQLKAIKEATHASGDPEWYLADDPYIKPEFM
ncbi:hypothetical protein D9758_017878 [Tetrapyrgos nigripes]|uniref:Uncharacterized protein n=1 Tax=Tetrapyrgos nigripes TaxID=182062 RepID=A0A8H5BC72_9AGAR|nr:hypothetical protein D9758_017878 [Tetrapyrgos nigripes]